MPTCGDFLGALFSLLNNPTNPLVSWPAVLVSPLLALATLMLAAMFSLQACFVN